MHRKYKNPRKPNIISMRISDEEMESIHQIMEETDKRATDLMREAFALFASRWQMTRTA